MSAFNINILTKKFDDNWYEFIEFIREDNKSSVENQPDFKLFRISFNTKKKINNYTSDDSEPKRIFVREKKGSELIPSDIKILPEDLDNMTILKNIYRKEINMYMADRLSEYKGLSVIHVLAYVDQKIKLISKGYDLSEDDKIRKIFDAFSDSDEETLYNIEMLVDVQDCLTEYLTIFDKYRQFESILPLLHNEDDLKTVVSNFKTPRCTDLKQSLDESY